MGGCIASFLDEEKRESEEVKKVSGVRDSVYQGLVQGELEVNLLNGIYKVLKSLGFNTPYISDKPGMVTHKTLKTSVTVSFLEGMLLLTLKTPKKTICGAAPVRIAPEVWARKWVERRLEEVKYG
jgi:hypothetical protein